MSRLATMVLITLLASLSSAAWAQPGERGSGMMQRMLQMADTDQDGRISKAEFMAMHDKRFSMMDANSDGFIDQTEREQAQQHMRNMMGGFRKSIPTPDTP
ncbi:MAG: hypothetical protein SVO96_04010 [Pseudomonadota bacterium]|nr:hypothetical protein [Pseudomonadota bacterium]